MKENIKLNKYQLDAVDALQKDILFKLNDNRRYETTLKSVTGSGKTVIATALMEELVESCESICFIWASIGTAKLHTQSADSIIEKTSILNVENIAGRYMGDPMEHKGVYIVNWEKLRLDNGILTRQSEDGNFFDLINKTKDCNTKIVLVIDECHLSVGDKTAFVKEQIKADVTINLSATPTSAQNIGYEVDHEQVIKAGFIKENIQLNLDVDLDNPKGELYILLEAANNKRKRLKFLYPNKINPLVVVVVPNGDIVLETVELILRGFDITTENGKLAMKLSKNHINDDGNIRDFDNPVEFIISKMAIVTGWDCPRAHILVKFKSIKKESFSKQLLGRILRMPERKHYNNKELNSAYVYTNEPNPKFDNDAYSNSKIFTKKTTLKNGINLTLPRKRLKEVHRGQIYKNTFIPFLVAALNDMDMDYDYSNVKTSILKEQKVAIDQTVVDTSNKNTVIAGASSVSDRVLKEVGSILRENGVTSPRSFKTVILILIDYICVTKGWSKFNGKKPGLVIFKNLEIIENAIRIALIKYDRKLNEDIDNLEYNETLWSPIEEMLYEEHARNQRFNKYAYNKCYLSFDSEPEFEYAEELEDDVEVRYWISNGNSGIHNFSIPYGNGKNFYPDFIIKKEDGSILITEIKGSYVHREDKYEALVRYGRDNNIEVKYILDGDLYSKEVADIVKTELVTVLEEKKEQVKVDEILEEKEIKNLEEWDRVVLTNHAVERLNQRFKLNEKQLLTDIFSKEKKSIVYKEYDQHKEEYYMDILFKDWDMCLVCKLEPDGKLIIITIKPITKR